MAAQLFRSSYLSTFILVATLGTAFTISMLWALGIEVLYLVDKGHLLVLLFFYASGITLLFRVIAAMAHMAWVLATNSIEDWIGTRVVSKIRVRDRGQTYSRDQVARLAERIARQRRGKNWYWYAIGLAPALLFFAWVYHEEAAQLSQPGWRFLPIMLLVFGSLLAIATAAIHRLSGRHRSFYRYNLAFAHMLLLFTAIRAGSDWVAHLQLEGPRVLASVRSWEEKRSITIAMPATEGILAFVEGGPSIIYIPWSEIIELQGSLRNASSSPTLSDTVSGTN